MGHQGSVHGNPRNPTRGEEPAIIHGHPSPTGCGPYGGLNTSGAVPCALGGGPSCCSLLQTTAACEHRGRGSAGRPEARKCRTVL